MATAVTGAELRFVTLDDTVPRSRVTLNRPEKRNALSLELMQELLRCLGAIGARRDVRAIVLEGAGAAFSAGHDLSELVGRDLPFYQRVFDICTELMETIHRSPAGDRQGPRDRDRGRVPAGRRVRPRGRRRDRQFATPGVKIGLFCSTPMVPLSRAIGRKRALEMLLTGEPISARPPTSGGS